MCGRYYRAADKQQIADALHAEATGDPLALCPQFQHRSNHHPARAAVGNVRNQGPEMLNSQYQQLLVQPERDAYTRGAWVR